MKREANQLMAEHSGQLIEKAEDDTERDYFMSGEEARNYGIVDAIISRNVVTGGPR